MMESKRKAVFVLGMHRSGTSALTRVLSLAGLALPKHIMQHNPDNQKGFWESDLLVRHQDEFLKTIGSSWDDPRPIKEDIYDSQIAKNFEKDLERLILEEFGQAPLFIIKDPRICRLLPLWIRVLKNMDIDPYFVLTIRHPDEVAASLFKRDQFAYEKCMALWCTHTLEAERETRGYPRVFTRYDTLLQDWKRVLLEAKTTLNLPLSLDGIDGEVTAFLSEDLRHNRAKDHNHLPHWAQELLEGFKENNDHTFESIRRESESMVLLQGCAYLEGKVPVRLTLMEKKIQELQEQIAERDLAIKFFIKILDQIYKNKMRRFALKIFFGGTHLNKKRKLYKTIQKKYSYLFQNKSTQPDSLLEGSLNSKSEILEPAKLATSVGNFEVNKIEPFGYSQKARLKNTVKIIAFYLPQFHPFPENDLWWGKGFTEWSNVTKAQPNFTDHYQPHYPIHTGYYDLRVPEVMEEQANLAKNYGISGFNYYFYWFDGKTLMETPLKQMLDNKKIDIPFCLTWANENWTRTWDGMDKDILIEQNHTKEDAIKFIRHIMPYLLDQRYLKINECPVLCVYRPSLIPNIKEYSTLWRAEAKKNGIKDLYLISIRSFDATIPEEFGFDASCQFPPLQMEAVDITSEVQITNPNFEGRVYDYEKIVESGIKEKEPKFKMFRTCMLSWDNTARRQNGSSIFSKFSLTKYKQWLSGLCNKVYYDDKYTPDEKLVFVNAWNEWAEGTHLEPDKKYGYGYLEATHEVLKNYDEKYNYLLRKQPTQTNPYAIILHLHYFDLWPEIWLMIKKLEPLKFDLYVSVTDSDAAPLILKDCPNAIIRLVDNRGRDILPFIEMLKLINNLKYEAVCKIHSKKSPHRIDGKEWRHSIFDSLLANKEYVQKILDLFKNDKKIGILAPKKYYYTHDKANMAPNIKYYDYLCDRLGTTKKWDSFPAGSMFWFRQSALEPLLSLSSDEFSIEKNMVDGTLPHAIERLFSVIAKHSGYKIEMTEI